MNLNVRRMRKTGRNKFTKHNFLISQSILPVRTKDLNKKILCAVKKMF